MTKTKAQLRAEAVERLSDYEYGTSFYNAMLGENYPQGEDITWQEIRDAFIDLLTNDGPQTNLEWMMENDFCGLCDQMGGQPCSCDACRNALREWLLAPHDGSSKVRVSPSKSECDTECYSCAKLAELVAEVGALRAKLDEERTLDDELLDKYLKRGEEIADLKERIEELEADNAPQPYIVVDGARKWVEADSREKLEADVQTYLDLPKNCRAWGDFGAVQKWLDRQAAITERERLDRDERFCDECWKGQDTKLHELQAKVDELTDETTFLHCIAKKCGTKDVPSLKAYVEQLEAKVNELTAENADLRGKLLEVATIAAGPLADLDGTSVVDIEGNVL